jgi:hypothetical protein
VGRITLGVETHGSGGARPAGVNAAAGDSDACQLELDHDARRELDASLLEACEAHGGASRASQHVEHHSLLAIGALGRGHCRRPSGVQLDARTISRSEQPSKPLAYAQIALVVSRPSSTPFGGCRDFDIKLTLTVVLYVQAHHDRA